MISTPTTGPRDRPEGMRVFCTQCGHQNPEDSRFCSSCGAQLSTATPITPIEQFSPGDADTTSTISLSALNSALGMEQATDSSGDASTGQVDLPAAGTALLVVKRGPNAGSRFLLDADITTAGRHPDSDIFLDDVTVSRRHAEFARDGDGFLVRDVGSLNGTYLDRERIESVPLAGGDEVQIGKYRLVYLAGAGHDAGEHP